MKFYDKNGNTFDTYSGAKFSNGKQILSSIIGKFKSKKIKEDNVERNEEVINETIKIQKNTMKSLETSIKTLKEDNEEIKKLGEKLDKVKEDFKSITEQPVAVENKQSSRIEINGDKLLLKDANGNVIDKSPIDERLKIKSVEI